MIFTIACFVDGQRATHHRLSLGQPVRGVKQLCKVVEPDRYQRMIFTIACFVDSQRTAHHRLRLIKPVRVLEQ